MADLIGPLGLSEITISRIERGLKGVPADLPQHYVEALVAITAERHQAAKAIAGQAV